MPKRLVRLEVYVTEEENERVKQVRATSGMWDGDGEPFGDPQKEVDALIEKYGVPREAGLDTANGEFCVVVEDPGPIPDEGS